MHMAFSYRPPPSSKPQPLQFQQQNTPNFKLCSTTTNSPTLPLSPPSLSLHTRFGSEQSLERFSTFNFNGIRDVSACFSRLLHYCFHASSPNWLVVKRDVSATDASFLGSYASAGTKRSARDRLENNADSSSWYGNELSSNSCGNELVFQGANILVDNKGCIKLADFEASKQVVELVQQRY